MKIEHIALWTKNIENLKEFYTQYFEATANNKYSNPVKHFESYFLTFPSGCRLEIMHKTNYDYNKHDSKEEQNGYNHIAFSVDTQEKVIELTETLRSAGFTIVSEPRTTGDGYFESCIFDPDGNRVEITI